MHADWLKRAYDGGLRLLVVHAVNNKVLCQVNGDRFGDGCDDMKAVDRQINAAKQMESYLDAQAGAAGKGWFRIAYSAAEARRIINSGGLAVVLGIEVDELFGCGVQGNCSAQHVLDELDRYYAMGVRHIFPIHVFDNAFGGGDVRGNLRRRQQAGYRKLLQRRPLSQPSDWALDGPRLRGHARGAHAPDQPRGILSRHRHAAHHHLPGRLQCTRSHRPGRDPRPPADAHSRP